MKYRQLAAMTVLIAAVVFAIDRDVFADEGFWGSSHATEAECEAEPNITNECTGVCGDHGMLYKHSFCIDGTIGSNPWRRWCECKPYSEG